MLHHLKLHCGTQAGEFRSILGFIALIVAVLLVLLVILSSYGKPVDLREVVVASFILAISIFTIVPEGLPIILVITLSLGMRNMARHKR